MNPITKRRLIISIAVTTTIIILLVVTLVILYFTLFKPKNPIVVETPVGIRHFEIGYFPKVVIELTLGLDTFIKNRNYAPYEYTNSTTSIFYRGDLVGSGPIVAGKIEARSTQNIPMEVELLVDKMMANPNFVKDVFGGTLNLTSTSALDGRAVVLKIFKLRATTFVECDIIVYVKSSSTSSSCVAKLTI